MAVTPDTLVSKFGRVMLALAVTLSLTNAASAVIDCVSAVHSEKPPCCETKAAKAEAKGCCCEVSTVDGHPAITIKAINADDLTKIVLALPPPQVVDREGIPSPVRIPITRLERPPPQIVALRLAPKRAPPCA